MDLNGAKERWKIPNAFQSLEDLANGYGSKPWHLVNPKITGKWMCIHHISPTSFDPPPNLKIYK
jgi:hypothetical protein